MLGRPRSADGRFATTDAVRGAMFRHIRHASACLALAALTACATEREIPFDHAANSGIKTIGVLQPSMSPTPTILLASDIGQSLGLVGLLVDASMQANRDKQFGELMSAQGVKPDANFLADVHAALAAHGYSVTDVPEARPSADLLKTYPKGGTDGVDAYLDIAIVNYGYVAAGIGDSTPYRPFVGAHCRLVRASDGAVLMQDVVVYNPVVTAGPQPRAVTISPDPAYTFKDFDTLTADPANAMKGMNVALGDAATSIGTLVQ